MGRTQHEVLEEHGLAGASPPAPGRSGVMPGGGTDRLGGLARYGNTLADLAMWFACTFTCVYVLRAMGSEGPWYPLRDAMDFTAIPPFRHRVLFVLLARAVQFAFPAFHDPRCYFVSQSAAAAVAFWAIRPWVARFIAPRLATLSRPLLLMFLVPTFTYWTFYDLGVVACYALALWALAERRFGRYLVVFALATLNHENSLLLVPLAALVRCGSWRLGRAGWRWVALQAGVYLALRAALFLLLPVDAAWQGGKLAYNLHLVTSAPGEVARTAMLLGAWMLMVVVVWARLPREIRWAFLTLGPGLLLVTLLFGQLNELRQFDALLPVLVVAMLRAPGRHPHPPTNAKGGVLSDAAHRREVVPRAS